MTLREKLEAFFKKKNPLKVGAPLKPMGKFPLIDANDVIVDILDYDTPNEKVVTLAEKLQGLGSGGGAGVGISKIAYLHTEGLVDYYQISFTDPNMAPFQFQVRNGRAADGSLSDADKSAIVNTVLDSLPIAEEVSV